jgi:GNAT superfamily N-acetyltransferase
MTALEPVTMSLHLPIVFRFANKTDLPKLEWYGQYSHFRNLFARAFREQLKGRRLMLVADCNNFPIGHIFVSLRSANRAIADGEQRAYLYSLRVMELFRGHGIGTRLILEAEAILRERGILWTTIAVAKDNSRARRLYERLGYNIFADDIGQWSYIDHRGESRFVNEPCWILEKQI